MPVVQTAIAAQISAFMLSSQDPSTLTPETIAKINDFANNLATVIQTAILSATVTVPLGIPVQVVPATGTGTTVAPIVAVIS